METKDPRPAPPPLRPREVRGPTGRRITREDLPPADTVRWVPRRKAELVCGLMAEIITHAEAVRVYALSLEEIVHWTHLYRRFGLKGLMTTQIGAVREVMRRGG